MTEFDHETKATIDSNLPFKLVEESPLQDEYMSASMRKWANENPKTTVGIGLAYAQRCLHWEATSCLKACEPQSRY